MPWPAPLACVDAGVVGDEVWEVVKALTPAGKPRLILFDHCSSILKLRSFPLATQAGNIWQWGIQFPLNDDHLHGFDLPGFFQEHACMVTASFLLRVGSIWSLYSSAMSIAIALLKPNSSNS